MKKINIYLIYNILKKETNNWKIPSIELIENQTHNPFKILLATILSARTKDEITTKAAKKLFTKVQDTKDLELIDKKELQNLIYPVGFYKTKTKYLKQIPKILKEKFNNIIPNTVEELTKLPGVGRKTANLVVAVAFKKPAICVDTHVHRIMNIWGYVKTKSPLETEMALRKKLPPKYWLTINSTLVAFGQGTCKPVAPHCDRCVILRYCPQIGVKPRKMPGQSKKTNEAAMRRFV